MIRWQQPDIRDIDGTNSWGNVTAAVVQNAKAFVLLQQIIEKPTFNFQIKYEQGVANLNFTNFYLAQSKRAAQRLEAAALCDLHRSDTISAVKNLRAMLALVKAMRDERLIISELVRMAIASIALEVNWEVLQSPNLTDEQLVELQHNWANLDFVRGEENALAMERAAAEITLKKWRSSNSGLQQYFVLGRRSRELIGLPSEDESLWAKARTTTKIFMWRYWWSYPDELRLIKSYQVFLETTRSAEAKYSLLTAQHEQEDKLRKIFIGTNNEDTFQFSDPKEADMHFILSAGVHSLGAFSRKAMRAETAKQMTITAIALKRYQLKHGNYPPNLGSLVPEFVSSIPLDPMDGQPLRYRLKADGTFLLYSVGENGEDDGGDPSLSQNVESSYFYWQNSRALDWVWPQPATAEEIQAYYAHQKSGK
jgi:hypothetical protein